MLLAGRFLIWRSEQESNPHWQYRKLQSYPLNDRSILFPEDREMNRSNYSVSGDGFQLKEGNGRGRFLGKSTVERGVFCCIMGLSERTAEALFRIANCGGSR